MDDIYKNIEEYNPNKKCKILIVFDDMIANMLSNKKPNPIVTEMFIRSSKLNIYLVFITQFYFTVPKIISLNTHYFTKKVLQNHILRICIAENCIISHCLCSSNNW